MTLAPVTILPQVIVAPNRDQIRDDYLRDFRFHEGENADTSEGTQPYLDGSALADALINVWAAVQKAGNNVVLTAAQGAACDTWLRVKGLPPRTPPVGASGFVVASASIGGTTLFAGDELRTTDGVRYRVQVTATYADGALVPVGGFDTGPGTNRAPATVLTWSSPRPGCGPTAVVWADNTGHGLTGGREQESDGEIIARVIEAGRNPPASGNDADYQETAKKTPAVAVQQAFTYPAILGPGTTALVFTMQPATAGASRLPNNAQIEAVETWTKGQMPHDDGAFFCTLVASPVGVALRVSWAEGADGWTDAAPWPPYSDSTGVDSIASVLGSDPINGYACTLARQDGDYSGQQPLAGQTIALWDSTGQVFAKKRIATVTGSGPWVLTFDATNTASDAYVPVGGQWAMPWSPSLASVGPAVLGHFDTLGPGEQKASPPDAGQRQKRNPAPPRVWPSVLNNRLTSAVQSVTAIDDAIVVAPVLPHATPVGTRGVLSRLLVLSDLALFPA